ncbi:MAG: MBL fold metallo-hydrolase [Humibacter sp.]
MTLDGTNTYVLREPGSLRVIVVDPGPIDEGHLAEIERFGTVELILLTHRHHDHSDAVAQFAAKTGAVARAVDERWCLGGEPLRDGERIHAGGTTIEVVATPGHTSDSVCFTLPDDAAPHGVAGSWPSILTGDTILGRGTTVIAHPDGSLAHYLQSLERLRGVGRLQVLPAHGPELADLVDVCDAYLTHRHDKLQQVASVVGALAPDPGDGDLVDRVIAALYADAPDSVLPAARASVRAQLAYLALGG